MKHNAFYIVQLDPEKRPNRLKFGVSERTKNRFAAYRTICPEAKLIKTWSCFREWETRLMIAATTNNGIEVGHEVYDIESIDEAIARIDKIFEFFPHIASRKPEIREIPEPFGFTRWSLRFEWHHFYLDTLKGMVDLFPDFRM